MKSIRSATVGNTAKLGSASDLSIDKRSNGGQVLGKVNNLGELIYKFNTKDQADMYLRTTEAIADYVGVEYGRDMRMLVKKSKDKVFTEPLPPRTAEGTATTVPAPGKLEKYRTELMIYHKDQKEYTEQKAKVFVVILGQCSSEVKNKLANDTGFENLEENDDVVGILKMLKGMAFSTDGVQNVFWSLQGVLRRLTAINQGPSESVANYHKRFLATTEVIEEQWGLFVPIKLTQGTGALTKQDARDRILSMIFLAGADKRRYGVMIEELNNSYLAKKDNYPTSVEDVTMLLSHYQGHQSGGKNVVDTKNHNLEKETSFAQLKKLRCFNCNEFGHVKANCPKLNRSHYQEEDEDEDTQHAESATGRSTISSRNSRIPFRSEWSA